MDAPTTAATLDVGPVLIGLFGGLAIFLFGMEQMTDAMKAVAGDGMRQRLSFEKSQLLEDMRASEAGRVVTAIRFV